MSPRLEDDAVEWDVGRYTIYGEIASGGMATVHIGRVSGAAGFSRLVAVKRMHPQFAKDPDFLAMFLDEARLAARIRHPNVVQTLDVIAEDDEVLLVMEYIHGDALARIERAVLQKNGRVPPRIASAICAGALHGLHAAHEAKSERGEPLDIIHRDVSPQNIIVGTDGIARIIDFGIAKAANQLHLTQEGELKGKLVYMAPEQLEAKAVITRQVDVFSMAVTTWEVFCGQRMFETTDTHQIIAAIARKQRAELPSTVVPELPPELDAVIMKGLAISPADRWKTAREFAEALEEAVPPATTTQVGAYVQEVVAKALEERQNRISEIEHRVADSKPSRNQLVQEMRDKSSDQLHTKDVILEVSAAPRGSTPARAPAPPTRTGPPPAGRSAPPLPARASAAAANEVAPRGVSAASATEVTGESPRDSRPTLPPAPPVVSRPTYSDEDTPRPRPSLPVALPITSDPFLVPESNPLASSPSASSSLEAPAIPTEYAKPAKITIEKIPSRRGGLFLALVLAAAVLAAFLYVPGMLKKSYVDAATAHGFTLTLGDVEPFTHPGSIELVDVTLACSEIPGVSAHAKHVHIGLTGLAPQEIVASDVEITIDASYSALRSSLLRYFAKHTDAVPFGLPQTVSYLGIEPAHVMWTQPFGAGTQVELRSVVLDVAREEDRKLGDDWAIQPSPMFVTSPIGPAGPWVFSASQNDQGSKARVSFDQRAQQNAGMDVVIEKGKTTVDIHAQHAPPDELSIKADAFNGTDADLRIDVALHAVFEKTKLDGTFDLLAAGWHAAGGSPESILVLTGAAHGDGQKPIDITETRVSMGATTVAFGGTVQLQDDGITIRATANVPLKCDGFVTITPMNFFIDTRDVGKWGLGLGHGCPAIKPKTK